MINIEGGIYIMLKKYFNIGEGMCKFTCHKILKTIMKFETIFYIFGIIIKIILLAKYT